MSTRFHDKWHGANHNSVSAIGIPDAGRDPIASYVFPFEGEFIMNNSPRNNNGMGHSEYGAQEIFDKWILSSERIDTHIVRSQQDEPEAGIVLSAKYHDGKRVVQTLSGTNNIYYLEVSGADNSEKFNCSYLPIVSAYQHLNTKKVGVSGEAIYVEEIDSNTPEKTTMFFEKAGYVVPKVVFDAETGEPTQLESAPSNDDYDKIIRLKEQNDQQLVELRVTDTEGHRNYGGPNQTLVKTDVAFIDGKSHNAGIDVGKSYGEMDTDGSIKIRGFDTNTKVQNALRNSIEIAPTNENGISAYHRFNNRGGGTQNVGTFIHGSDITRHGDTHQGTVKDETYDYVLTTTHDSSETINHNQAIHVKNNSGGGLTDGGNRTLDVDKNETTTIGEYRTTTVGQDDTLNVSGNIYATSRVDTVVTSLVGDIVFDTVDDKKRIYLDDVNSIGDHDLQSRNIIISAETVPEHARDIQLSGGLIDTPEMLFDTMTGTSAFIQYLSSFSATTILLDVVQSETSGFNVYGMLPPESYSVPLECPPANRLHVASAGIWDANWLMVEGDARVERNFFVIGNELVSGNSEVKHDHTIGEDLSVGKESDLWGDVRAHKSLYINEALTANNISGTQLHVAETSHLKGNVQADANLVLDGSETIKTNLEVRGDTNTQKLTANGSAFFNKPVEMHDGLSVTGDSSFADTVDIDTAVIDRGHVAHLSAVAVSSDEITATNETIDDKIVFSDYIAIRGDARPDRIEIGKNAKSDDIGTAIGNSAVASAYATSVGNLSMAGLSGTAVGYNAHAKTGAVAIGDNAYAVKTSAIQIGNGRNEVASSMNVCDVPLLNIAGKKVYVEVIPTYNVETDRYEYDKPSVFTNSISATTPNNYLKNIHSEVIYAPVISAASLSALTNCHLANAVIEDDLVVHDHLDVPSASVYALSAHEITILRSNASTQQIEAVGLDQYIREQAGDVVPLAQTATREAPPLEQEEDNLQPDIVEYTPEVEEAQNVSYAYTVEKIENYNPETANHVATVLDAAAVKSAGSVGTTKELAKADVVKHANKIEEIDVVNSVFKSSLVNEADTVVSATKVDDAQHADLVEFARGVNECTEVVSANGVHDAGFVYSAETVLSATNVKEIHTVDGYRVYGPAIRQSAICDGIINVVEWINYYKTDSAAISLEGLCKNWEETDKDVVFSVRMRPKDETYTPTILADKPIVWAGEDPTKTERDSPILLEFRVSFDEIIGKIL